MTTLLPLFLRKPLFALALGVPLLGTGCAVEQGSGRPASETRKVAAFDAIEIQDALGAEIDIRPGDPTFVEVSGDDNLIGIVRTEVKAGTLIVSTTTDLWEDTLPLAVAIRVPALQAISGSGAADIEARGVRAEALSLSLSGASKMKIDGAVNHVTVDASGASTLEARALEAAVVDVSLSGASSADVCATESADLHASGASHVDYHCGPARVTSDITGGSSVEAR